MSSDDDDDGRKGHWAAAADRVIFGVPHRVYVSYPYLPNFGYLLQRSHTLHATRVESKLIEEWV